MTLAIVFALAAGILVSLSRQINGRLALSTSALAASYWNHVVGFAVLTGLGLALGGLAGLWPPGALDAPWHAYLGGPIGVVFVASGSWLIARIGAVNTALLVIGGQMVSGVALDFWRGDGQDIVLSLAGVVLIISGVALTRSRG